MSDSSAPPSRSRKTSSTRCRTTALVDFVLTDLLVYPRGVPVVQPGVVDRGHLLHVLVGAQVGRPLERQPQPVGEGQAGHLGVAPRRADRLPPLPGQLLDGPP